MKHSSTPWWKTDLYDVEDAVPPQFDHDWCGPNGLALVRAWPSGITDPGWGLTEKDDGLGFMARYLKGDFSQRKVLFGFDRDKWTFAFIMRSMRLVVIDIDGKNGGIEHAKRLGMLPPTMAETSKSGDGYHLWYLTEEEWDDDKGYAEFGDRIGIEQGVDFRATGCVYHHKQQRWNLRPPALLPPHLATALKARDQKIAASNARITTILANHDDLEVLMLHEELTVELNKPIPEGKRNNTLFAIGSQMATAQVPDWEDKVEARATELGLDSDEADKLVSNIGKYAGVTP